MRRSVQSCMLSILIVCLMIPIYNPALSAEQVRVNVDILNVRQNPGTDQEIIGKVHRDEVYPVLDEQGSWYQIRLSDGSKGWVAAWLVSDASDQAGESFISPEVDHLNVRSGPSTSFRVIKRIHQGETYPVLKREGDWVNIRLSANEDGWVAGWFVQTVSDGSEAESTQQNKATVNVPLLNVRAAPTVESEQLGQLKQGDAVQILEINEGWYRIEYEGQTAWIAGEFTETIASGNQPEADGEGEEPENRRVKVTAEQLNMREGPTLVSPVSGKLKKDDILEVTDSDGDWYEVKTEDGQTGWVANWLVTDVSQNLSNGPHIRILNQGTNLRAGPGLGHDVISRADAGERFPVLETAGDWYQIRLPSGENAYVAGWIVAAEGFTSNIERPSLNQYLKGKVIVVDPGHGGKDNGAEGPYFHTLEKHVNLKVSKLLASKLQAAGAKVILTRRDDRYLTLQSRVDQAIVHQADAFISVHHNSHENHMINGVITFFYTNGNDRALAHYIQQEVVKQTGRQDLKARRGNYYVLRQNPQLAILCELGFLSNYGEEMVIRSNDFQEKAAEGIFRGIIKYFQQQAENS